MKTRYSVLACLILFLFTFSNTLLAQERLSLEDAIRIALENNYTIKLTGNDARITENNVKAGIAGFLPSITGNFNTSRSKQNTDQTLQNGTSTSINNAISSNLNYGVSLNWQIFDGFGMFANYNRLRELYQLGELNARTQIQTTIADVINTYYNLVKQQEDLKAAATALEISQLRLRNAQNRFEIGRAARLEVLNAQVDLNADTTSLLRQQDTYRTTQIQFNELLARNINTPFTITDTILIDQSLVLGSLQTQLEQSNPALQTALINQRIAELNLKTVKAGRLPSVSVNTGYNFSNSRSQTGFAREQNGRGLTYGLTASIPIFNGFLQNRYEQNARLEIESSQYDLERTRLNVNAQLAAAYQTYLTNLELVRLENANLRVARQNLDITVEKYRLGSIVPLELREAQRNYIDATARFSNAQYEAKLAEVALKEITGQINF